MKKLTLTALGAAIMSSAVACGPASTFQPQLTQNPASLNAQSATSGEAALNQIVVGYTGTLTPQKIQELERKHGLRFKKDIRQIKVAVFAGTPARSVDIAADPQIVYAGQDQSPRRITGQPQYVNSRPARGNEDPMIGEQWSLKAVNAADAWKVTRGENVIAAVVDTGVDLQHPDLKANLVEGYNAEQPGQSPQDGHYHGTHVAGIIAAAQNNGIGVSGIAPQAKVMPVRAISRGGVGEVADGIVWAADHGARVINLSLGWDFPSPSVEETIKKAVKYAIDKNVVICAALSNSSRFNDRSVPDNLANKAGFSHGVIGVGNVDVSDRRQGAYGNWKSISSPGTQIMSTLPNNRYGNLTGTSMATPMVTGIVALMISQNPGMTTKEVKDRIMGTAVDLGDPGMDDQFGAGRINAAAVLQNLRLR